MHRRRPSLRPSVVFEDFDRQSCVVREYDASLHHPQQADLTFGLVERAAGIYDDVSVETLANGSHGGECGADFERESRKNQLPAAGRFDGARHPRIIESVDGGTAAVASAIDDAVVASYRAGSVILGATVLRLIAWAVEAGEIWLVMQALGQPLGIIDALILESLSSGVRAAAFMLPSG